MLSQHCFRDSLIVLSLSDQFHEAMGVIPIALLFESAYRLDGVGFEVFQILDAHEILTDSIVL